MTGEIKSTQSHLCNHFTTFARSYLGEELENQDFSYVPGKVSNIPEGNKGHSF